MKKLFISFVALAAIAAGLVSCNSKSGQYKVAIEPMGNETAVWEPGEALVSWDNTLTATDVAVSMETRDEAIFVQLPDDLKTDGVRRFVHPAAVYAGEGKVCIPTVQSGIVNQLDMPVYAEAVENSDVLNFMSLCGVVRLHLTTPEQISSIAITTEDSLGYMTGLFTVSDYPTVNLNVNESMGAVNSVRCEALPPMDFTQGADVDFFVAPGNFKTFTVTMTTPDGRVCVKNPKEGMEIVVERNNVSTVNIGTPEHLMVFE